MLLPIEEVRRRDGRFIQLRTGVVDADQLLRFCERQRLKEERIENGKDGGIGPDPEREGEDRNKSEPGRFPDSAAKRSGDRS